MQNEKIGRNRTNHKQSPTLQSVTEGDSESSIMKLRGRGITKGSKGPVESSNEDDGEPLLSNAAPEQPALKAQEKRYATRSSMQRTYRSIRFGWSLMTLPSKMIVGIFGALLASHVILGTIDAFFGSSSARGVVTTTEDRYAVLINTYKRPQMLREAVLHYSDRCGKRFGVYQVFVLWADQETLPPDISSFYKTDGRIGSENKMQNQAVVRFVKLPKDSLNSRFLPITELESEAVFMVDDDLRVSCESLAKGYLAWRKFQDSLVGFYPRLGSPATLFSGKDVDAMTYHNWPEVFFHQRFNIILTKASFLHKKYLDLYSSSAHPTEIKDYVDARMNCEDIAMAMLVANHTQSRLGEPSPPIYVEGIVSDAGLFGGISTGGGHMGKRSECLTDLTRIYKRLNWGAPLATDMSLDKYAWQKHSPGFWWQHRPSNFFEWIAIWHFFL